MNKILKFFPLVRDKKNTGFTLVETLVAVSIFSVSILGLLSVLASGITNTTYAKQKLAASYLAQEGIEYMRNMRDTFVLYSGNSQTGWDAFNANLIKAGSLCQLNNGCYFNADSIFSPLLPMPMTKIPLVSCVGPCPPLTYDATTGKYGYSSVVNSGFTRKIQITQIPPNEIKISSTVSWTQNSGVNNVTFSEDLFNWVE
jgi:prepilin-type N-terminal cleavage/methylation domain-containing protein